MTKIPRFASETADLRLALREMLEEVCPPSLVRTAEAAGANSDSALWSMLVDSGWVELCRPSESSSLAQLEVLLFELGRVAAPVPMRTAAIAGIFLSQGLSGATAATELAQSVASGAVVSSAMSDGPSICNLTPSSRSTEGTLSGTKVFVHDVASASSFLLLARSDEDLFWVNLPKSENVTVEHNVSISGDWQSRISFQGVPVTVLGRATPQSIAVWHAVCRFVHAAWGAGLLARVLELVTRHATERVQFGRAIGSFQAVQHKLADMSTGVQASIYLSTNAAQLLGEEGVYSRNAQSAALEAQNAFRKFGTVVLAGAHQVFGGMGVSKEHDFQLYSRRLRSQMMVGDRPVDASNELLVLREIV